MGYDPDARRWWEISDGLFIWSDESAEHLQDIVLMWESHHNLRALKKQFPNYGGEL